MKPIPTLQKLPLVFAGCATAVALMAALTGSAQAASQTWSGGGALTNWDDGANWVGLAAPGATSGNSSDVATFNAALVGGTKGGSGDPITIDPARRLGSLIFDTANAGAYQIGTGANLLQVGNTGVGTGQISINAAVTTAQIIAAPIQIAAYVSSTNVPYTFRNDSTTASATLTFTGAVTANISTSRPSVLTLTGTNTGDNLIAGNLSNPSFAQTVATLTKNGAGRWILRGSNTFSGSSMTVLGAANGIQINAGTLVAQNNNALGSTAGSVNNYINNGGTLEIDGTGPNGSITLNNALSIQLNNGGTLRSRGINTIASTLRVDTATPGLNANIGTATGAGVFTLGNNANDVTGGAADSTLHVTGPGTVTTAFDSNYLGNWSVDAGNLTIQTGVTSFIADTATLFLLGGGTVGVADTGYINLGAGVNETVGGLSLNGAMQAMGTYGSTLSAATFTNDEYFAGTGIVTVVPEPGTFAMLLGGAGMLIMFRRGRRA